MLDDAVPSHKLPRCVSCLLSQELGVRRLPGIPPASGNWPVRGREVGEGIGEIELDDEVVPIAKGDMIVVPPGVWHTSRPTGDSELHILICALPQGLEPGEKDHYFE